MGLVLPAPRPGERVTAIGASGSGKSEFLQALFPSQRSAIAVDTKLEGKYDHLAPILEGDAVFQAKFPGRYVWRPPLHFKDDRDEQDRFFQWVWDKGRMTLLLDEVRDVANHASFSVWLDRIATRGRSKPKYLSLWTSTQYVTQVPPFTIDQASWWAIFDLGLPKYQAIAEGVTQARFNWDAIAGNNKFYLVNRRRQVFGPWCLPRERLSPDGQGLAL